MLTLDISQEEEILSAGIFKRLETIPLIDRYEAYQILDDEWTKIAVDLEIIQSEGFEATKKVDPNMVMKKKEGKDQEVQEGWVGRILPFDLVQQSLLVKDYRKLKEAEDRLAEIDGELAELLEAITEDDKENNSVFSEDSGDFVPTELAKEAKQIQADMKKNKAKNSAKGSAFGEDSYEAKILKADELLAEEKDLKKNIKVEEAALHLKTKSTIEALSDDEVKKLLEEKWIAPLVESLHKLPDEVIGSLSTQVEALAKKIRDNLQGRGERDARHREGAFLPYRRAHGQRLRPQGPRRVPRAPEG